MAAIVRPERLLAVNEAILGVIDAVGSSAESLSSGSLPALTAADTAAACVKAFPALPVLDASGSVTASAGTVVVKDRKAIDGFVGRVDDIKSTFRNHVAAFEAACEGVGEAGHALEDVASSVTTLSLDANRPLAVAVLNVVRSVSRLTLLLAQTPARETILSMYALACRDGTGSEEMAAFPAVAEYLAALDDPVASLLTWLRTDCRMHISGLLRSLCGPIIICQGSFDSMGTETFALLSRPAELSTCTTDNSFLYLEQYTDIVEWVAFGFLVCPDDLEHPEAMELLRTILKEGYVLQLFRNRHVFTHTLYADLFNLFPAKGSSTKLPTKPKQLVKDSELHAVAKSGYIHRQRRMLFQRRAEEVLNLLQVCSGLIGPKFHQLLALGACLRHEVEWFVLHAEMQPRKGSNFLGRDSVSKAFDPSSFADVSIIEFIGIAVRYVGRLRELEETVRTYYSEYLRGAHLNALQRLQNRCNGEAWYTSGIKDIVAAMAGACDTDRTARTRGGGITESPLQVMRINWLRALAALWSGGGATTQMKSLVPVDGGMATSGDLRGFGTETVAVRLVQRCNLIALHSRFVDDVPGLLSQYCGLQNLWWFFNKIEPLYEAAVGGAQATVLQHAVGALGHLQDGLSNFGDPSAQLEELSRRAQLLVKATEVAMIFHLKSLAHHYEAIDARSRPLPAFVRNAARRKEHGNTSKRDLHDDEGVEQPTGSDFLGAKLAHAEVAAGGHAHRCIMALVYSAISTHSVAIGNHEYNLMAVLSDATAQFCVQHIAELLSTPELMPRDLQSRVSVVLRIVRLTSLAGLPGMQTTFLKLMDIMSMPESGRGAIADASGDAIGAAGAVDVGASVPRKLAEWLTSFLSATMAPGTKSGVIYDVVSASYVADRKLRSKRTVRHVDMFFSAPEIRALGTTLGTSGALAIERALLDIVSTNMTVVKAFLVANESILIDLLSTFGDKTSWRAKSKELGHEDVTLVEALIAIGHALAVRGILLRSAQESMRSHASAVYDVLAQTARQQLLPVTGQSARNKDMAFVHRSMSMAAMVSGVDLDASNTIPDERLIDRISELCTTAEDFRLLRVLPAALATVFQTPHFAHIEHVPHMKAYTNNVHMLAMGTNALLSCCALVCERAGHAAAESLDFRSFAEDAGSDNPFDDEADATENSVHPVDIRCVWVRQYVVSASLQLLHLLNKERKRMKNYPFGVALLVLEDVVDASPFVGRSWLERWLPYTLLQSGVMESCLGTVPGRGLAAFHAFTSTKTQ